MGQNRDVSFATNVRWPLAGLASSWVFAAIVLVSLVSPLQVKAETQGAQIQSDSSNVIDCLKVLEALDSSYRQRLQIQCLSVAADICESDANETYPCLNNAVMSMREYYEVLMPLLPNEIDQKGYKARSYARAIIRLKETFEGLAECDGLVGNDYSMCEFTEIGASTIDIFYRARLAQVALP
jgi:hypothetical protein